MILKKSQCKKRRVKGSVLFTVLAVMFVMIIVVMTTITLAGIASKKAYSNWFDNQTNYTAQSLVDNVVRSFQPGGENVSLGKNVIKNLKTKDSTVSLNVSGLPAGYGTVESFTLKNVGTTDEYNFEGTASEKQQIIKVTAVVNMGGERSSYSTYVIGDLSNSAAGGGAPGGYISTAELDAATDAPNTFGRIYAGIDGKAKEAYIRNQTRFGGDIFYNAEKMIANASAGVTAADPLMVFGRNDPVNELFSGLAVTGTLSLKEHYINSTYPNKYDTDKDIDLSKEKYYNMPYIYCDKLLLGVGDKSLVRINGGMNVYCGEVESGGQKGSFLYGTYNLMCIKNGGNNSLYVGKGSNLIGWMDSLRTDLPAKHSQAEQFLKDNTGNIYCKGNLELKGDDGGNINGNVYVLGDLKISGANNADISVGGNVYVGGTISSDANNGRKGIAVTEGNKLEASLGKDENTFISKCDTLNSGAGQKFKEVMTVKIGTSTTGSKPYDKMIYQTLDHLQAVYTAEKDGKKVYVGAKDTSNLKDDPTVKDISEASGSTIRINSENKYFKWSSNIDTKVIYIDPGADAMWINIGANCRAFDKSLIVVNDANPKGSVNFFIDSANPGFNINKTNIVTRTYAEKIFNTNGKADFGEFEVTMNGQAPSYKSSITLDLTAFPSDEKEVPHIFLYAASDNKIPISITNDGVCTFEVVAPSALFSADADSGVEATVNYTYNTKKGETSPNDVKLTKKVRLRVIGSLETGKLDNDNQFAYFYVDDISGDEPADADDDVYKWLVADGYSTY